MDGAFMNLCLACRDLGPEVPGGLARATCDLAEALADEGHSVHLLTNDSALPPRELQGVSVKRLRVPVGSGPLASGEPESALDNIRHAAAVYREVRRIHEEEEPVSAVLAPLWRSEGAVCLLDHRFPTIVSCMTSLRTLTEIDGSYRVRPNISEGLALEREALSRSRYLHGLSEAALGKTVRDYDLRPAHAAVIGRGLRDRHSSRSNEARNDAVEILFVGRLEHRKGVDTLLAAARELAADGVGAHFTLAGPPADQTFHDLFERTAAAQPRLRETVDFVGVVSDHELDRLFAAADVVCVPSRYESHGVVLIEAMMFGKPIVTCDAGGIGEVVEPGHNALVSPVENHAALAQSLRLLADDAELRVRLGAAGRKSFEQRFEASAVARRMLSLVDQVIALHPRSEATLNDVTDPLAGLVRDTLAVSPEAALAMAHDLLDPSERTRRRLRTVAIQTPPLKTRTSRAPRVTAVVLTRNRPGLLRRALGSLRLSTSHARTIVIDNGSSDQAAARAAAVCARHPDIRLERLQRNLGCAGGRRLGADLADTEFVLFLDDDAELLPGALDHLVAQLDSDPDAGASSATVVQPDGIVQHSGGWFERRDGVASFGLLGADSSFDANALPPTGSADWVPGTAALVRRELLQAFPIDERMTTYYEDNEWCYRIALTRAGVFRRSREAIALHHLNPMQRPDSSLAARSSAVKRLEACARFYERHGIVLAPAVFDLAPELRATDGTLDVAGARMLLELIASKGGDWTLAAWMRGDLDAVLTCAQTRAELAEARAEAERLRQEIRCHQDTMAFLQQRHETLCRIEDGGWWRLRGRVLPILRLAARIRAITGPVTRP